jgi:uncharacterized protein YciI
MKIEARLLLAAVLLAVSPLLAQTPAPASAPAAAPAPAKTWFVRLIPPRTTFIQDMTAAEGALMDQHFDYWKDQNARGVCLFGGPVLDPKGPFGILVIRAATLDEALAIASADPSVKAGLNRIEVAEIRVVFVPHKP